MNSTDYTVVLDADRWTTDESQSISVSGMAFHEDTLLTAAELIELFVDCSVSKSVSVASDLNGFFSIVYELNGSIIVVSDHVGSRAIFYCLCDDTLVSDSFTTVRSLGEEEAIPRDRRLEFRMATYVAGSDTLDPSIHKTEPGTVVRIDPDAGESTVVRYYTYRNDPNPQAITETLYSAWKRTLNRVFDRVLRIVDNRQIIIGLSGGYDSRLIVTMLDRLGYDNVVTYTLDKGYERPVAKQIADQAGYDWFAIDWSPAETIDGYESESWLEILRKLGQSGMSHTAPETVGRENNLKRSHLVDENAIRFNGHQLYHSGKVVPPSIFSSEPDQFDTETLVDAIFDAHYRKYRFGPTDVLSVKRRIEEQVTIEEPLDGEAAFEVLERWYWNNRMTNFLNMRALFLLDFPVWYPLLDKELVEFWNRIPRWARYNRRIYNTWVERLYRETYDSGFLTPDTIRRRRTSVISRLYRRLRRSDAAAYAANSAFGAYIKKIDNYIYTNASSIQTPAEASPNLAFVDSDRFERKYTGVEDVRYFLADEILSRLADSRKDAVSE